MDITYEEARQRALAENKPLVVVVTAEWCGACRILKRDTIDAAKDDLKHTIVVYVDKDKEPETAKKLLGNDETLPQLSVFHRGKRWLAKGLTSVSRLREMLRRAK